MIVSITIDDKEYYGSASEVERQIQAVIDGLRDALARFKNPWTVEILNQQINEWVDFCLDAPLTLSGAEKREGDLRAEHPNAKFRVVPWINSWQRQQLTEALTAAKEIELQLRAEIRDEEKVHDAAFLKLQQQLAQYRDALTEEKKLHEMGTDDLRDMLQLRKSLKQQLAQSQEVGLRIMAMLEQLGGQYWLPEVGPVLMEAHAYYAAHRPVEANGKEPGGSE